MKFNRFTRRAVLALSITGLTLGAYAQTSARPTEVRIGYQKSASLFVLQKSQGTLEKKLAPLGATIKWVEFPAGPQLLEGLNVGSIDVGYVGEAPPSLPKPQAHALSTSVMTRPRPKPKLWWLPRTLQFAA